MSVPISQRQQEQWAYTPPTDTAQPYAPAPAVRREDLSSAPNITLGSHVQSAGISGARASPSCCSRPLLYCADAASGYARLHTAAPELKSRLSLHKKGRDKGPVCCGTPGGSHARLVRGSKKRSKYLWKRCSP